MRRSRVSVAWLCAWCIVAVSAGCVGPAVHAGDKGRKALETPAADLVWPVPPDPPRIRYLGSLTGAADYRKKQGRWKRLLLGRNTDEGIRLGKPYGVTTDAEGVVYVSDTALGLVVAFDDSAREVRTLPTDQRVGLVTPVGLATDAPDRLWVADAGGHRALCIRTTTGELLLALGGEEGLQAPAGLAVDAERDRLYVVDSHLHQIVVYSRAGAPIGRIGERGPGPGQFNFPTNVILDPEGNLYVVDTGNFRVQLLDPAGVPLSAFGRAGNAPGNFHRPKGIALDTEGHVYVVDAAFSNFQIFDAQHDLLLHVGTAGSRPGQFWLPAGIHIDGRDRVYVVDQMNRRVQLFQFLGTRAATASGGPRDTGRR